MDPAKAACAAARGAGFNAGTQRRPFPGEVHEPGVDVILRRGAWTWSDFLADGYTEADADRAVRRGMEYLEGMA